VLLLYSTEKVYRLRQRGAAQNMPQEVAGLKRREGLVLQTGAF
jgi:hypothetical protein